MKFLKRFKKKSHKIIAKIAIFVVVINGTFVSAVIPEAKAADFLAPTANTTGSGGSSWTNPDDGYSSDDSYATATGSGRWVSYSDFNIPAIPTGSTIDGIAISIEGQTTGKDVDASLSWNHSTYTATISAGFTSGATDTIKTVGGATNIWGRTWAAGDFTNTNFRARLTTAGPAGTFSLDQIMVKVYYTPADTTAPTVVLTSAQTSPTNHSPINMAATFSEPVAGFTLASLSAIINGTAGNLAGSGTTYTFDVTPAGQGMVLIDEALISGVTDIAGNQLNDIDQFAITYDTTAPTVILISAQTSPTNHSPINMAATFSESVTGFTLSEPLVVNGVAGNLAGSGTTYTFDVTPSAQGAVVVDFSTVSSVVDAAGNHYAGSDQLSIVYDTVGPSATTGSKLNTSDTTNNNNPIVSGNFNNGITTTDFYAKSAPNYDVKSIEVVFEDVNTHDKFTKFVVLDADAYLTGQYTTEGAGDFVATGITPTTPTLSSGIYSVTSYATDLAGNSTPEAVSNSLTIDTVAPASATNLQITAKTPHSVTLNWTASTSGDTAGYRLYWGTEQGKYTSVRDIGNVTNYTLSGLNPVTTYYFKVVAYDRAGNSSLSSNEVSEKTPAEISGGGAISSGGVGKGGIVESAQAASPQNENKAEGQNEEQKTQTKGKNNLFLIAIIILILGVAGFYYRNTHPDKFKKVKFPKLPGLNNK